MDDYNGHHLPVRFVVPRYSFGPVDGRALVKGRRGGVYVRSVSAALWVVFGKSEDAYCSTLLHRCLFLVNDEEERA